MKNLKYPLYLFIAIFIAKIAYVIRESYYNFHILTITTAPSLKEETMLKLNEMGHTISAIGITLLLVPLFYKFVKKYDTKVIYSLMATISFVSYIVIYNILNIAIDKIVEINKDKRHDAFYLQTFKYGILNNMFAYNSYVDFTNQNSKDELSIENRILLTNIFVLLNADKNIIDKIKVRGETTMADIYISMNLQDDFNTKYKLYKDATVQVASLYEEFAKSRETVNINLQDLKSKLKASQVKESYKKFQNSLRKEYKNYLEQTKDIQKKLKEETTQSKIASIQVDLYRYFQYKRYKKAQDKYKSR